MNSGPIRRLLIVLLVAAAPPAAEAQTPHTLDLLGVSTAGPGLMRAHGHTASGADGVPVAGGLDCDGDGFADAAFAAMQASPLGRTGAGELYLVFGNGHLAGALDTAIPQARILEIFGDGVRETTGSEIWMDDVTGDGIADLLIARQNYTPATGREGAGALTILVGGPALSSHAATLAPLDLRAPPVALTLTTLVGAEQYGRLGIWMRTGDVSGDGIADIVIGADQEDAGTGSHRGAAYVVRGGSHLAVGGTIDLVDFGSTGIAGHLARVEPPPGQNHLHFGATVQIADLDGNGRGEVMAAAALNRSGATLRALGAGPGDAHGTGGTPDGTLYIAWDDNFLGNPWAAGLSFEITNSAGAHTIIDGGDGNVAFGEEILGGLDYDDDGAPDLFVGDIIADLGGGLASGSAHVFFDAARLRGLVFDRDAIPAGIASTDFVGPQPGAILGDTALHGDFDGDGIDDLAFSSPHASPLQRVNAGILHVFFGQPTPWPSPIDVSAPLPVGVRATEVIGAFGDTPGDIGDVLSYSAAAGDLDGDGRTDVITNEMLGNGVALGSEDVGNLIVLGGGLLSPVLGTACSNLIDDDDDGTIDFPLEPGCLSASDDDERGSLACDNGLDDDGDGRTDFALTPGAGDPGCRQPTSTFENPQCQDGVDNDSDGFIDFDGGLSAGTPGPNAPDPQCSASWRNRERPPVSYCGLGAELAVALPLLARGRRRAFRAQRS